MGLSRPALRFLARTARDQPLLGNWLTLGRQCVYATFADLLRICREEGVRLTDLPPESSRLTNIPSWQRTAYQQNTSDVAVLRALGAAEAWALDLADFEGAELIHDLNLPVPQPWHERFDGILDSGTLEHIFDLPAALANLARMLRVGGRAIHISPCNNWANHGFYQFSPTLLADYYQANRFAALRVFVAEESGIDYQSSYWDLFEIDPPRQPLLMTSRRRLMLVVIAQKTADSTADQRPVQSYYRQLFDSAAAGPPDTATGTGRQPLQSRLKRLLPVPVKTWLRRWVFGRPDRKPWGAKPLGRLK